MPGYLLHLGATVLCLHAGQAQATAPNPRVKVSGQMVVTQSAPHTVVGCPFNVSGSPVPCVTAQWMTAALRVKAGGFRCYCKIARRSAHRMGPESILL